MPTWKLYEGDCLEVMRELPSESVDAVVADPPYGLSREPDIEEVLRHWLAGDDYKHRGGGFMGKTWDSFVPGPAVWRAVFRVVKPGGHILCFAGTRTVDLMGISLRLGGFEIRDCLQWLYGSGFPKSLDVSKAIDKMAGAEREVLDREVTVPATDEARRWHGWGTALKPAVEPIFLARKPLSEATVAENVLKWGTGGLNIDGCRIPLAYGEEITMRSDTALLCGRDLGWDRPWKHDPDAIARRRERAKAAIDKANILGRWPANVLLDEEAAAMLDEQSGIRQGGARPARCGYGASRFFFCAKASQSERTMGGKVDNDHPTVKPIQLMRYLCRLVTPPGGTVLDPFAGSGTTLIAAVQEGFNAIGIEREPEYCEIIRKRMAELQPALPLTK